MFYSQKSQNNVNVYIVYELANWPTNPIDNFKTKDCLLRTFKLKTKATKWKFIYQYHKLVFDSADLYSFANEYAQNLMTFGADDISLRHSENYKKIT